MSFLKKISIDTVVMGFILLAVFFKVVAALMPEVSSASEELANQSNGTLPLASFFVENGLVILVIMAAIILSVLSAIGFGKGKGR